MIEKIDSLDAECETILKDSRARGEAIREALVADALEEAEKIRNARAPRCRQRNEESH